MTVAPSLPSGLPAVDRQWGGLAAGRAYLLVGRAGAGRSALALQTARAAVEAGERCLLISPRAPEALVEMGRGVGLDLAAAHAAGRLRLLRVPAAAELAARGSDGLAAAYRDLAALAAADPSGRVVVEDFTPLVQFDTFERFHDAFAALVQTLRDEGTTLVVGLGDPANEASQRLLGVVERLVDGTVRLGAGGDLVLSGPASFDYPSSDGASVEASPPPHPGAGAPADGPSASGSETTVSAPGAPADHAPPSAPADGPEDGGPDDASAETPGSGAVETPALDAASAGPPQAVSAQAPDAPAPDAPAPDAPAPDAPAPDAPAPDAPAPAPAASGPVATEITPPPPPDPSLLAPDADPFGHDVFGHDALGPDPADALFEQGFLADSGPQPPATPTAPPAATTADLPSFTPLGAAAPARPDAGFRAALDAAFAGRAAGTPFVVVALRIDPASPDAEHFETLDAGLRSALRGADEVLVDGPRKRAAVVLPDSGAEAGQALFSRLQSHIRTALGAQSESVLQSIAAVTLVDGQPFQTAADLLAYAIED